MHKIFQNFLYLKQPLVSSVRQRYLLGTFIKRIVQDKVVGSMGGSWWTFIEPLSTVLVYIILFSTIITVNVSIEETGTDKFSIFFLCGFIPWFFFSESLTNSANVLLTNANLITKVIFPVELLPLAVIASSLIASGVCLFFFLIYIVFADYFHICWFYLFLLVPLFILFTTGISYFLAAAGVFFRDTENLLRILLMVLFFSTPIVYPLSNLPEDMSYLLSFNPMVLFIENFRAILLVHTIDWSDFVKIIFLSILSYGLGTFFFMKTKNGFGDII